MSSALSRTNLARGYPIALLSAVFLATTAILIRYLTLNYHIPAMVLAFWRDVFVALTLFPILALLRPYLLRLDKSSLRFLTVFGLLLAVFNALWTLSVALNGASVATVLAYCSAAFTALLGWLFFKERLDAAKILAVAICLLGCVLVSGAISRAAWQTNPIGILSGILAGLGYAIYTLLGRSAAQRGLSPWTTLLYTFAFASVFLMVFNLFPGGFLPGAAENPADLFWLGGAITGWAVLFLLAAGPTVAGFGLYNLSLVYLPASVANLVVITEPLFTAIFAYFLLDEKMSSLQVFGGMLILAGVIFLRIYEGRLANRISPQPADNIEVVL